MWLYSHLFSFHLLFLLYPPLPNFFLEHTKFIIAPRALVYSLLYLDLYLSTGGDFCHFGNIWRHFWLLQMDGWYWPPVGRSHRCCSTPYVVYRRALTTKYYVALKSVALKLRNPALKTLIFILMGLFRMNSPTDIYNVYRESLFCFFRLLIREKRVFKHWLGDLWTW